MNKNNNGLKVLGNKVLGTIKNKRGSSPVTGIVISAIILIALILLNTPIRTFISDIWVLFSNFIETKLTTLFQS